MLLTGDPARSLTYESLRDRVGVEWRLGTLRRRLCCCFGHSRYCCRFGRRIASPLPLSNRMSASRGVAGTPIGDALSASRLIQVGHRGAATLAPENTLEALGAALEHSVDMVEFDVVRGPRGDLVLAHDSANVTGQSPTLEDALGFLRREAQPSTTFDLDLKVEGAEHEIVAALHRFDFLERTIVCALHPSWLRAITRIDRDVILGFSYPRDRGGIGESGRVEPLVRAGTSVLRRLLPYRVLGMVERSGASAVMLHHSVVSDRVVERCATRDVPVFAWTVDDGATLGAVTDAGVHGVISNDPRVFA